MAKKKKSLKINIRKVTLSFYIISLVVFGSLFAFLGNNTKTIAQKPVFEVSSHEIVEPPIPIYSCAIVSQSLNPILNIGEETVLNLEIRNTGNVIWNMKDDNIPFLGTSRPLDRLSVFYNENNEGWSSNNRISNSKKIIRPGEVTKFSFRIVAPEKSGIYREFFAPVINGLKWLNDNEIYWDIEVRDPKNKEEELKVTISGSPEKYIKIKLSEQKMYVYENGLQKYEFITSTGLAGMDTPKGTFEIRNKFSVQYSSQYDLFMDNWMAFTASGSHGIHSLPYWKLKNGGRLYEGENHLGQKVSHGCVRLSLENSKILYDWAEVGTPIFIED